MAQVFYPTALNVITDALTDIGAIDPEGGITPTSGMTTGALRVLNYLVTAWQAHGMQVWCQKQGTYSLSNGVGNFTIGPSGATVTADRPLSIQQAWLRNTVADPDQDIPIRIISREEYNNLATKASSGTPICLYYDPEYDRPGSNSGANAKGKVYIWPVPDTTVATTYDLYFIYTRPIADFNASSDTLDFPQEWYNAVRWNLAEALCPSYEVPIVKWDRIRKNAQDSLALALSWDRDQSSVMISPAQQ